MTGYSLVLAAVIVLIAAFVRSVSGFGFALIATPLLLFVFDPKSVVVINVILNIFTAVPLLVHTRKHVDIKRLLLLCSGSIFGIPIGAYLLVNLDPSVIKLSMAILLIPFSVLMLLGHSHRFQKDTLGSCITGFVSGILVGSTSLGGPPVVLFLLNQGLVKERFVGTITAYFLFINIASVSAFSTLGMVTTDLLGKIAILLPTALLGLYLGIKVLPKTNPIVFRRIAASIVSISALAIIVTSLLELT